VKPDNCIGVVSARRHRDLSVGGRAVSEGELTQLLLDEPASASDERNARRFAALGYASLALGIAGPVAGAVAGVATNRAPLGVGLGMGGFVLTSAAAAMLLAASARDEARSMKSYNEHARATQSCQETFERALKSLE
jgi:hypothetical protein